MVIVRTFQLMKKNGPLKGLPTNVGFILCFALIAFEKRQRGACWPVKKIFVNTCQVHRGDDRSRNIPRGLFLL